MDAAMLDDMTGPKQVMHHAVGVVFSLGQTSRTPSTLRVKHPCAERVE
jgi:hypothetical protein